MRVIMPYHAYRIRHIVYVVGFSFNHSHLATALEIVMHFEKTILEPRPRFGLASPFFCQLFNGFHRALARVASIRLKQSLLLTARN